MFTVFGGHAFDGKRVDGRGCDFDFGTNRCPGRSHQARGLGCQLRRWNNFSGQGQLNNRVVRIIGIYGGPFADCFSGIPVGFDL